MTININARGSHYGDLRQWLSFNNSCIESLTNVILKTATGASEERLHGAATIRYDAATIGVLTEAVGRIQEAIRTAGASSLLLMAAEKQASLCAARSDKRFQLLIKTMTENNSAA